MKALQGPLQGIAQKVSKNTRKQLKPQGRFLRGGAWAEDDQMGHRIVRSAHGVEATSKFAFPR